MSLIKKWHLFIVVLFLSLSSCQKIDDVQSFNEWLNAPENGCVVNKKIGGVKLTVKFQPSGYIILKDFGKESLNNARYRDSVKRKQRLATTFLLEIEPDNNVEKAGQKSSVMYEGVEDYRDYTERTITTNFFMDSHIRMFFEEQEYQPLIAVTENMYELSDTKRFLIAFDVGTLKKGVDYDFVYDDPFFGIGKVQFSFSGTDLVEAENVDVTW